jgi:hypothetical protein
MFDHAIWPEKHHRKTSAIYALNDPGSAPRRAHGVTSYQIRERQGAAEVSKQ